MLPIENAYSAPPFNTISFCFGTSQTGWDYFTIYFLMEEGLHRSLMREKHHWMIHSLFMVAGEIYGLCPVVPFNVLLPESIFTNLHERTSYNLEEINGTACDYLDAKLLRMQKKYRAQLHWLSEGLSKFNISVHLWRFFPC